MTYQIITLQICNVSHLEAMKKNSEGDVSGDCVPVNVSSPRVYSIEFEQCHSKSLLQENTSKSLLQECPGGNEKKTFRLANASRDDTDEGD